MPKSSSKTTDRLIGEWHGWLEAALAAEVPANRRLPASDQPPREIARRPAAVLIGITAETAPAIFLTERSQALTNHPGQISFPGGGVESTDDGAAAASLREAQEEIGLDPDNVRLLGELPRYRTVSGFDIRPFVGWVVAGAAIAVDGVEVARLFSLPLAHAIDPGNYRLGRRVYAGRRYYVYSLDYQNNHIWGATAGMLVGLAQRMAWVRGQEFEIPVGRDQPT